ncbi:MAG: DUF4340 domain-containing protein [Lachnospiraceae bacterium]|nr:DUF4340 domain-containing protein [Lachnospiraceae bacterium]
MSKKKKNLFTLLGLSALLIVCLVLYFVVPKSKDTDGDETETTAGEEITVDEIDSSTITGVEIQKEGKTTLSLLKEEEVWHLTEDKSIPLDEESVTGLFDCLNPVKAAKTVEKDDSKLSDYGLDHPVMIINVTAGDTTYQYHLGIAVPVEGGYYGLTDTGDKIYCFNEDLYTTFDISRNVLIQRDELPDIEENYMTYLLVENKNGKDFEAKAADEEERVDQYSDWNITKPYAEPLAASVKDWSTILESFTSLSFGGLVQYKAADLSKYGLKDPASVITVTYYEAKEGYTPKATATPSQSDSSSGTEKETIPEKYRDYKTLKLYVGNKKGENYYVCLKGSRNVYTMTEGTVESMTKLDAYASMDHSVYSTMATDIKGYDVTYGNTTLKVTRKDKEKDENGSSNMWTLNGNEIASEKEEDFLKPYSAAYLLTFTSKAKESVKPKSKTPVLTIVYHENNRDVTVRYLPYDDTNFYRVDKNGMDYFLVDKLSVDDVITKFKEIEKLQ